MRYAFYVSGQSRRLIKLIEDIGPEIINNIILVVSDVAVATDLKAKLEHVNIKYIEHDRLLLGDSCLEKNINFSKMFLEDLHSNEIDYVFSFGKHILKGDILTAYKDKIVNFHPSVLPMYPGLNAIDNAVEENKVFLIGNTAHFIDEGVDTGKIIMQSCIPIRAFNESKNYDIVLDIQIEMLKKIMSKIENNELTVDEFGVKIQKADYESFMIFPNC